MSSTGARAASVSGKFQEAVPDYHAQLCMVLAEVGLHGLVASTITEYMMSKAEEDALRQALMAKKSTYEVMEKLQELDAEALERVLTVDNTKNLLTVWGSDPVNDYSELTGLWMLRQIPQSIVQAHAEGILSHLYDIVDDHYGHHENYPDLWGAVVDAMAVACPDALAKFVGETLVPRLKEAATSYKEEAGEAGARRPSLFQTDLLDTTAMLGQIAKSKASVLTSVAAEVLAVVDDSWADLTREDFYRENLEALRAGLVAISVGSGRGQTKASESESTDTESEAKVSVEKQGKEERILCSEEHPTKRARLDGNA